ncbi:MAG: acyltransferase domain-containing protein [Bacteroidales bacterium]|nr:acyltransferase domain-containing protein [Bacteroidales bacterium]
MKVKELLAELNKKHVILSVEEEKLKLKIPKGILIDELINELKKKKSDVIKILKDFQGESSSLIINSEKKEYYHLSFAQRRIFLLQQMDLESVVYNMPYVIPLGLNPDKEKIEATFQILIQRHESMRTSFELLDEEPIQCIKEKVEFNIEEFFIDKNKENEIENIFKKPFYLDKAPLIRAALVNIKGKKSVLLLDMHHIINDAFSDGILEKEFFLLYSDQKLTPLKLQYKDYSEWQNSKVQQKKIKGQADYWIRKFERKVPVLSLPTDYKRPVVQSHEGASVSFILNQKETEAIKLLTEENGITISMAILSVFKILLSKLSGQEDIVVGTPLVGRNYADLFQIVGMFVNTLAIRNEVKGEDTVKVFFEKLMQTTLESYENQDYQFEDLIEKILVIRDAGRNPLFDVKFNMINKEKSDKVLSDFSNHLHVHKVRLSKFDLSLTAVDYGKQILLNFEYCTKLFKSVTIDRYITYFKNIFSSILINQNQKIVDIDLINSIEKENLIQEFLSFENKNTHNIPVQMELKEIFNIHSGRIAIIKDDIQITYSEINKRASIISNYIKRNFEKGSKVGVFLGDEIEMIISILGVIKAGCAYVPKSDVIPVKIEDVDLVISNSITDHKFSFIYEEVIEQAYVNFTEIEIDYLPGDKIAIFNTYSKKNEIIKTSITNENLSSLLYWFIQKYKIETTPKTILSSDFDVSFNLLEIMSIIFCGGVICITDLNLDYTNNLKQDFNLRFEDDEPVLTQIDSYENDNGKYYFIPLSSATKLGLDNRIKNLKQVIQRKRNLKINDLSYTLCQSKALQFKKAFISNSINDLQKCITKYNIDSDVSTTNEFADTNIVFMYSGLGSQYVNMGRDLYENIPFFKETIDNCFDILNRIMDVDLKSVLYPIDIDFKESQNKFKSITYSAPIKFIYEYSLSKLLISWGIKPTALIGHSFGEYVAASIAEVVALSDILKLIVTRSKLMLKTPDGAMTNVFISADEINKLLFGSISIAAINGPENCIISGLTNEITDLEEELNKSGILYIRLNFDKASHSSLMNLIEDDFKEISKEITIKDPQIDYITCFKGSIIKSKEDLSNDFWFNQLRSTVNFSAGLSQILTDKKLILLEIGPGQNLIQLVKQHANFDKSKYSLYDLTKHQNNKDSDLPYLYRKIEKFWSAGFDFNYQKINKNEGKPVNLNLRNYDLPFLINKFNISHLITCSNSFFHKLYSESNNQIINLQYLFFYNSQLTLNDILQKNGKYSKNTKFINLYGTELTSMINSGYEITQENSNISIPVIGKGNSFSNLTILDENRNKCGIGMPGKIAINTLFSEYSHENKRNFISNPFGDNLIYISGDIGRLMSDGNIEFLKSDSSKKKVRNYYFYLDEVEKYLKESEFVLDLVIILHDESGELYCYVEFKDQSDLKKESQLVLRLKNVFLQKYSELFIPEYFIVVRNMPRNEKGEIDKESLFIPNISINDGFVAPRNEIERKLAEVWSTVLNIENIGINKNFFQIGGDSIKAIQIQARMNKAGYRTTVKSIFEFPTISDLAPRITLKANEVSQVAVSGLIKKTPAQHHFFKDTTDLNHHNQSVLLHSIKRLDKKILEKVILKLQEHHDALRIICKYQDGEYVLNNKDSEGSPISLKVYNLEDNSNVDENLTFYANQIQRSINLEDGPLMKLGLFHLSDGDRLLIVIHHLVTDGISWRIIFEDIETLYKKLSTGDEPKLPPKSNSFKDWSDKLTEYAESKKLLEQRTYWKNILDRDRLSLNHDIDDENIGDNEIGNKQFTLSATITNKLLTQINGSNSTEINDILLCGLGCGIREALGNENILVYLEGHGREELFPDIDISRTIGWFTTKYPILLEMKYIDNLSMQINSIKENLQRVPDKGIGYGVLKHLSKTELIEGLCFENEPKIIFNYLGQFDTEVEQMKQFSIAKEYGGDSISSNRKTNIDLAFNCMIAKGALTVSLNYKKKYYSERQISDLINHYKVSLINIVDYSTRNSKIIPVSSDFTYKNISLNEIDFLSSKFEIEDIDKLTPMQLSVLPADVYGNSNLIQFSCRISGDINILILEKSFNELLKRHETLRSVFYISNSNQPLKVVLKERKIDFLYHNVSEKDNINDLESILMNYEQKDKEKGFDLSNDTLIRVTILKIKNKEYRMIISSHQAIMDAMSINILMKQLLEIYQLILCGKEISLKRPVQYQRYCEWVKNQDYAESEKFWVNYLRDVNCFTDLSEFKKLNSETSIFEEGIYKDFLNEQQTHLLNKFYLNSNVLFMTIFYSVWGIILSKLYNKNEVVFGAILSGRQDEIRGLCSAVGSFSNIIPIKIQFDPTFRFIDLLKTVESNLEKCKKHGYIQINTIKKLKAEKLKFTKSIVGMQRYNYFSEVENIFNSPSDTNRISLDQIKLIDSIYYNIDISVFNADKLEISFQYNKNAYSIDFINQLGNHFKSIFNKIISNEDILLNEINL